MSLQKHNLSSPGEKFGVWHCTVTVPTVMEILDESQRICFISILIMIITDHELSTVVKEMVKYVKLSDEISVLATYMEISENSQFSDRVQMTKISMLNEFRNLNCIS